MDSDKSPEADKQADNSDDLISELARLMANEAAGKPAEPQPAPAPTPEPARREPGFGTGSAPSGAAPQPSSAPSYAPTPSPEPSVRVPGSTSEQHSPVPERPASEVPSSSSSFRSSEPWFDAPAPSKPESRPEPQPTAQRPVWEREPEKPVSPPPSFVAPRSTETPRSEPSFGASPTQHSTPTPSPAPAPTTPGQAPSTPPASSAGPSGDFDFGFGSKPQSELPLQREYRAPEPTPTPAPVASPSAAALAGRGETDDPIGALISEQFDLGKSQNSAPQHSAPEPHVEPSLNWNDEPAPQPSAPKRDPLDDIESLIGQSVRVQSPPPGSNAPVAPAEPQRVAPHPSQITQPQAFAPQEPVHHEPAPTIPQDPELAAEAAILAAADTGYAPMAEPEPQPAVPASPAPQPPARDDELALRDRSETTELEPAVAPNRRLLRVLAPVIALVMLGGFGAAAYFGLGLNNDSTDAPLLVGDADAVKDVPEETADTSGEAESGSVVFDDIDGDGAGTDGELLVIRDESGGAVGSDVSRVINTTESGVAELAEDAEGLLNRRVRTVTVRPDGTIVSGEEALAGSEVLPVDRPDVPELPGDEAVGEATAEAADDIASLISDGATAAGEVVTETGDAAADAVSEAVDAIAPDGAAETATDTDVAALEAETATTQSNVDPTLVPPVPLPRPANRAALAPVGGTTTTTTTTTPVLQLGNNALVGSVANPVPNPTANPGAVDLIGESTTPAATQTTTTGTTVATTSQAPAYVQMSSQRSETAAQQTLVAMQSRYGTIFGSNALEVQQVDLGESGVFYRVRLPTSGIDEATQVCTSVRAAGGDCFVRTD